MLKKVYVLQLMWQSISVIDVYSFYSLVFVIDVVHQYSFKIGKVDLIQFLKLFKSKRSHLFICAFKNFFTSF